MKNPELYILVALGFAFSLSWIVSKFAVLPIDIYNTSTGFLFAASANLSILESSVPVKLIVGMKSPAFTDYAIVLVFLQIVFGILIISSYFAHRDLLKAIGNNQAVKVKDAAFYSWSSTVSLFSCYVMAIFFLHSSSIFSPVQNNSGELNVIVERWMTASHFPLYLWIILFVVVSILRYFREPITSFAKP